MFEDPPIDPLPRHPIAPIRDLIQRPWRDPAPFVGKTGESGDLLGIGPGSPSNW
jgi:hypothetical protein